MKKKKSLFAMILSFLFLLFISAALSVNAKAADKDIMDNYVLATIMNKAMVARFENSDGLVAYQVYDRNLKIDVSNIDEGNLALSMKVYVEQIEGDRNPLEIFTAQNAVGLLELANTQDDITSYLQLGARNLKRADGKDLVAGEWNDVLIPFSAGQKGLNFDSSNITWFRLCLAHLPKDMGYQSLRLKDVCIVDTSRKAQANQQVTEKKWDTTYDVGTIPYTFDDTIKSAAYVGTETKLQTPIDLSKHNPEKLQLQMDIEVENLTNPGNVSPLMENYGKAFIELSSSGSAADEMIQWKLQNLPWKNGKATYRVDFSNSQIGVGKINLQNINYLRMYFVHTTFKDQIKLKISDVKIIDTTNECTLPTIFSDGMMFQQNKQITVWGTAKVGNDITVRLLDKNQNEVTKETVKVNEEGKWIANLQQQKGSYDTYTMEIDDSGKTVKTINNILVGEVWLACGQSNMALNVGTDMDSESILANATNSNLRFFLEPTYPNGQTGEQPTDPMYDVAGSYWGTGADKEAVNKMSAVAYSFAKKLQARLNVPVGVLNTPIGGTVIEAWIPRDAIESDKNLVKELEKRGLYYDTDFWSETAGTMSTLYNQKVGPLENYKIAGAIWYQGESNSNRSELYDTELSLLKKSWSEKFGFENNSMPFIYTQVAPGQYDQGNNNMQHLGYLSEAMTKAFKNNKGNNMAMITIYDLPLDHVKNGVSSAAIHPRIKTPVGERMCTAAMNMLYGGGDVYTAPVYKSMEIKNNAIYITFDYVGKGLSVIDNTGKELHGFSIAGEDGIYVNAKAEIVGKNKVKVYNERMKNPKNVNYAFNNFNCNANLKNSAGIPAAPFRTKEITGVDTTYNPTKDITYFTAIDWIYADKDVWVYDNDNPVEANQKLGFRPAWKTENGSYSYDETNKAEGIASVKFSWENVKNPSVGPAVTYGSQKIKYGNFKNISLKISNPEGAAGSVALKVTSGGKEYTVMPEAGQSIKNSGIVLENSEEFKNITFDMSSLKDGNNTVNNVAEIWNNISDMKFVFETLKAGSANIDDISFGMTEKVNDDAQEDSNPVASCDFTTDEPTCVNMSTDKTKGKYTSAEVDGKKCIKLGQYEYVHFKVENDKISADDNDLIIKITYFDNTNAYFGVQYNAIPTKEPEGSETKFKLAPINRGGMNKWVSSSVCLNDASFRHAQFNQYDFRIYGNGAEGTYVAKVEVIKKYINPDSEAIGPRKGKTDHADFKGKSFAGYQAWFGTGEKNGSWGHYSYGGADEDGTSWPRKDHISIDYFPYVDEYDESALAQTGFDALGSGKPTKLYSSTNESVINTHFKWMNQYGIDGAAIQRFAGTIKGRAMYDNPENTLLYRMKTAAENNNRLLYIMYDISGGNQISDSNDTTSISSWVEDIKFDWVYNIEHSLEMTNSDAYATVDGKPVVCLWGTTVAGRPDRVADYQELIDFFHKRDCYVILGVGRDWSTNANTMTKYQNIFKQADMISPWLVGSNISSDSAIDGLYSSFVEKDWKWCQTNNVDYYPVVFSGFSWALWHNSDGAKPNQMPRNAGQNFWYQAYKLKQMGIDSFYIAMFDEYDEGTAIAKNASDYFDIPKDQWFVTASCDGYWCSQDFQLRVAGEAIKMVKGLRKAEKSNPILHSLGPVYYRNSFESKYVNCPTEKYRGDYPVDPCFKNDKEIENNGVTATVAIEKNSIAKTGDYMTKVKGSAEKDNANYLYRISETNIKMTKGVKLSYSLYAVNEAGKNTSVSLICDDGTVITAHPKEKLETGKWTTCTYNMPADSIKDKSIVGIGISYNGNKSDFEAYFDDIILEDNPNYVVDRTALKEITSKAGNLKKDDYTADSWNNLQNALTYANNLPDEATQEDMDEAVKLVELAIEKLVKKPVESPPTTTVPPTTQAPTTTVAPTTKPEKPTTKPAQPTTKPEQTSTAKNEQSTTVYGQVESTSNVGQHAGALESKIVLNVTKKKLGKKEKFKLKAKLIGVSGKVKFKSSNKKIASVTSKGKVRAKRKGKVIIMAYTDQGLVAVCKITVKKAPKYIRFKNKVISVKRGKKYKLKAKLSPKSAGQITYKSKNKKVAKIDKYGNLKLIGKGEVVIVAETYNRKKTTVVVKVK